MKTTEKRKDWAASRKATMQGLPLKPSADAERLYRVAMQKAIKRMTKDYQRELEATLKPFVAMDANAGGQLSLMFGRLDTKWGKFFGKLARTLATTTVKRINRASKRTLDASLKELSGGLTIKTPKLPESMITALQAATARNAGLIVSIQQQYHQKIEQAVLNNLGDAQAIYENARTVVDKVYFIGETVEERAAFIARDQVSKLNAALQHERMKAAGITQVRWRHSGGSADPRRLHMEYDGKVFDLDDPPVIDERTGQKGWAGEIWNCRCYLTPVLNFGDT